MLVSLIVAVDEKGGIGIKGQLPWRLSGDLRRFKQLTMGHHILMGRKTYETIGRPLPGRTTIIITRNSNYQAQGCLTADSVETALSMAEKRGEEEAFVIGGGEIFIETLPIADKIYLTQVHTVTEADTFFPNFKIDDWDVAERSLHEMDDKNEFRSTYMLLVRRKSDDQNLDHS